MSGFGVTVVSGEPDERPRIMLASGETKFCCLLATGSLHSVLKNSVFQKLDLDLSPSTTFLQYINSTPLGEAKISFTIGNRKMEHDFFVVDDNSFGPDDAILGSGFIFRFNTFGFNKTHVTLDDLKLKKAKLGNTSTDDDAPKPSVASTFVRRIFSAIKK